MVAMLEKTFFPKWLQVLCSWMSNMPNYDEITKWYLGWKTLFSDEYRNYPPVVGKWWLLCAFLLNGETHTKSMKNLEYPT